MKDIVSYVEASGNAGFSSRPLNALDALVFSQLAYLPLEIAGADLGAVAISELPALLEGVSPQSPAEFMLRHQLRLMKAAADTRRFGPLVFSHFTDEIDPELGKQFSAVRVSLPRGMTLVAYRGTDLSLAGWMEDFRLAYESPVPAQRRAAEYLRLTAEDTQGSLTLCGHSKGGNLAVYAAAFCGGDIQGRLSRVYSFDAPGQAQGVLETPGYQAIRKRIRAFLPERSMVGVLLSQTRPFVVVACRHLGLLQHNPFHWRVAGGAFVKKPTLSSGSLFLDKSLNAWILAMTRDERRQMTEAVFTILQAPGEEGFDGLTEGWFSNLMTMWKAAALLPRNLKKAVWHSVILLMGGAMDTLAEDVRGLAAGVAQGIQQRFADLSLQGGDSAEEGGE